MRRDFSKGNVSDIVESIYYMKFTTSWTGKTEEFYYSSEFLIFICLKILFIALQTISLRLLPIH